MSGRGRGRGFGRGRGGGPDTKDDDGQYVAGDVAGPPPVYPDIEDFPQRNDPEESAQLVKAHWRALTSYSQRSPFHIKATKLKASGQKRSLHDFMGNPSSKDKLKAGQLAKILTLNRKLLPDELYTDRDQRNSTRAASQAAQKALWGSAMVTEHESTFDRLAKLEELKENGNGPSSQLAGTAAAAAAAAAKQPGAEEEEEQQQEEEIDEPNEDDYEDDEYMQGAEFDDDEGYDDDAAGDDGADDACY